MFGDDDGKEFIYKEPKITGLAEISQRLEAMYSRKHGRDSVKLIMESAKVTDANDYYWIIEQYLFVGGCSHQARLCHFFNFPHILLAVILISSDCNPCFCSCFCQCQRYFYVFLQNCLSFSVNIKN